MSRMSAVQVEAIEVANSYLTNAGLQTINEMMGKQAEAVQQAMKPVIQIEVRDVYGISKAYPANKAAELFAQIAGTKTLCRETLRYAEQLGFEVQEVSKRSFMAVAA